MVLPFDTTVYKPFNFTVKVNNSEFALRMGYIDLRKDKRLPRKKKKHLQKMGLDINTFRQYFPK